MARIEMHRTIEIRANEAAVGQCIAATINAIKGGRINVARPDFIAGRTGSQTAFYMGGKYRKSGGYPVRVAAALQPQAEGTGVQLTLADDIRVGFRWGLRKHYDLALNQVAETLLANLRNLETLAPASE